VVYVKLKEAEQKELHQASRQSLGRIALRAHMVLLSSRGYSVPKIAEIHDCGEEVVRCWLHRYQEQGVAGLADEPRSGRPPNEPLASTIIETQINQSPSYSGHYHSCWSVGRLTAYLQSQFHLRLSAASVRRCLKQAGWRWRRPRLAPALAVQEERDPEAGEKRARIAEALQAARAGLCHLLYLDECDLHLLPVVRSMWMKGPRLRIPTPGKNHKQIFYGARNQITDAWHWTDFAEKRAVRFVEFLDQLVAAYPRGKLVWVIDNAPIHTAKWVDAWLARHDRVEILWLPKYAAHTENPVERVWGLMKDAVAANRLRGDIDLLAEAARGFFRDLVLPKARIAPLQLPLAA
jgi:transposase